MDALQYGGPMDNTRERYRDVIEWLSFYSPDTDLEPPDPLSIAFPVGPAPAQDRIVDVVIVTEPSISLFTPHCHIVH